MTRCVFVSIPVSAIVSSEVLLVHVPVLVLVLVPTRELECFAG